MPTPAGSSNEPSIEAQKEEPLQEECSPAENHGAPLPVAPWVQALVEREEGKDLPPPPEIRQGQRTGMGVGYRASLYLLEVAQASKTGELTRRQAELACKGWGPGTIRDGLKRLADDGLVERPERGVYRLTEAGRNAPPAPPGMLPLKEPEEEAVRPLSRTYRLRGAGDDERERVATGCWSSGRSGADARRAGRWPTRWPGRDAAAVVAGLPRRLARRRAGRLGRLGAGRS